MGLAGLNTAEKASAGVEVHLRHPSTGAFLKNDDGSPMTITIMGKDSPEMVEFDRTLKNKRVGRVSNIAKMREAERDEILEEENVARFVHATKSAHCEMEPGKWLECTPDALHELYSNPGFAWVLEQVMGAYIDRSMFLKNGSATS